MRRKCWLILILFIGVCLNINAQTPNKKPQKPTIDYLTIDLDTGHPTIYWTPPPLNIPLWPNPTGYYIYKRIKDNLGNDYYEKIDSVPANVYSYTDNNSDGNLTRLYYDLASKGPTEPSPRTLKPHSNTFLLANYDSCNHKIDLEWQQYEGWNNHIDSNFVYMGSTSDWTTYQKIYSLPGTRNKVSVLNISENQDYYFYIESIKDVSPYYTTKSNLLHKFTFMPKHPASMSIDSILAEDKKTNIYFRIDPSTALTTFKIDRWEQSDTLTSKQSWKPIYRFTNPIINEYADTIDRWAARTRPFFYRIDAINSCKQIVKYSNLSNSITLVIQNKGMKNIIQWDALHMDSSRIDAGNTVSYRVTRYAYDNTETQLPPVVFTETTEREITDDVSGFEGQGYSIKFCYQIEAIERNSAGTQVMLSRSRLDCTEIVPGVVMPEAIVPNDTYSNNGNSRAMFAPIITFQANYKMSIYNRWGELVFAGENKGWDGKDLKGRYVREGAYIYKLTVYTLGNRNVIKTGSVTVVYK